MDAQISAPETAPDEDARRAASCILAAEGIAPFPTALVVHPDDPMHRHLLRLGRPPAYALGEYVQTGLEAVRLVRRVAATAGAFSVARPILDFAAGFGRVARFVQEDYGPGSVDAADVLAGSAAFNRGVLGLGAFDSTFDPALSRFPRRYGLIYVISLFTHLPAARAAAWVERLRDALNDDGILILTTHGLGYGRKEGLIPADATAPYVFLRRSEIDALDRNEYGTVYYDPAGFRRLLESRGLPGAATVERGLFGAHDVHVVRRDGRPAKPPPASPRGGFSRLSLHADGRFSGEAWIDVDPAGPGLAGVRTWLDGAPGPPLPFPGAVEAVDDYGARRLRYRVATEGRAAAFAPGARVVGLTATEKDGARALVAGEIMIPS